MQKKYFFVKQKLGKTYYIFNTVTTIGINCKKTAREKRLLRNPKLISLIKSHNRLKLGKLNKSKPTLNLKHEMMRQKLSVCLSGYSFIYLPNAASETRIN